MKLFVILIFMSSCTFLPSFSKEENHDETGLQDVINQESVTTFMSREEILEEVKNLSKKNAVMDGPLSEEDKERERNLIPDQEFLRGVPTPIRGLVRSVVPKDAPQAVDLRHRDTPIKHQDNGKCTAYAGTAAIESTLQRDELIPGLDLSDWNSWSYYRQYSAEAFIKALTKNRIGDEVDFPQYGKAKKTLRPYAKISKQTYLDDNIPSVVEALGRGNVVYLAMKTPKEMLRCAKVISPLSKAASGGHALLISGYYLEGKKVIGIIKNSWGKNCGDNGYQYLPLEICHKKGFYCSFWEIEAVDKLSGVEPSPLPLPPAPVPQPVCTRKWYAPWKVTCK